MFKRVLDLFVAGTILVLAAPILGLVVLAVKFSSPGPILFRQRRVGQGGRDIEVLKFRTLRCNNDSDTQWSVIGDARLTPIGRFLRRTSLDELLQLWGVLRGDMSLVGQGHMTNLVCAGQHVAPSVPENRLIYERRRRRTRTRHIPHPWRAQ